MTRDRYGQDADEYPDALRWCPHRCHDGWLSPADADVMVPCPLHRPPAREAGVRDYADEPPTPRAQLAITRADHPEEIHR